MPYSSKEKADAYKKKWRLKNKNKIAQQLRENYLAHREERKERGKVVNKAWRLANKDRLKSYREANKERINKQIKTWVSANKARHKSSVDAWHKRNRPLCIARSKAWHLANPEKSKEISRKYRRMHPHAWRKADSKRRARKLNCPYSNLEAIARWEKRWRSKRIACCYWCQKLLPPSNCHTDHIIPLAREGHHSIENLCVACAHCNATKSDKPLARWNTQISQPVLNL